MSRKLKSIAIVAVVIIVYYVLQLFANAVHYNCYTLKDDCVPPINLASEVVYRVFVHPVWLDRYDIEPTMYTFSDGNYSFWQGDVDGETVVMRVREDESPVLKWIVEEKLPGGINIRPADGNQIARWISDHPEFTLHN